MEPISKNPNMTLITIPGTSIKDRPNVTRPRTNTAITTPGIVPDPPAIETPPRITMVTTSSSQPSAMLGRVDPTRAVRRTAAMPERTPLSVNISPWGGGAAWGHWGGLSFSDKRNLGVSCPVVPIRYWRACHRYPRRGRRDRGLDGLDVVRHSVAGLFRPCSRNRYRAKILWRRDTRANLRYD